MSFIESALLRDEKIVHFTRPHWIIFVPGFLILVVAICLMHYGPTALPGSDEFRFFGFAGRELWSASAPKTDYRADYTYELAVPGGIYFLWVKMGNKEEWHQLLVMR